MQCLCGRSRCDVLVLVGLGVECRPGVHPGRLGCGAFLGVPILRLSPHHLLGATPAVAHPHQCHCRFLVESLDWQHPNLPGIRCRPLDFVPSVAALHCHSRTPIGSLCPGEHWRWGLPGVSSLLGFLLCWVATTCRCGAHPQPGVVSLTGFLCCFVLGWDGMGEAAGRCHG